MSWKPEPKSHIHETMKVAFSWRRWSTLELNISQICGISGTKSLQNRHSLKSQVNCNSFSSRMSFSAQKQAGAGESMNFPWNQNRHLNFVPLLWFRCRTCKGLFPKVSLIDRWQILTVFFSPEIHEIGGSIHFFKLHWESQKSYLQSTKPISTVQGRF